MKIFHPHKPTEIAATSITNASTAEVTGVPKKTAQVTFYIEKSADLMVTQNINKPIVYVGENVIYTIIVTNKGPSNATNVILYDIFPVETTFVSIVINQGTYDHRGSLITCSLGDLSSGSLTIITVTVTANVSGIIKNFTRVAGNEYDPNLENNMFLETTTIYPVQPLYRGFDFF